MHSKDFVILVYCMFFIHSKFIGTHKIIPFTEFLFSISLKRREDIEKGGKKEMNGKWRMIGGGFGDGLK